MCKPISGSSSNFLASGRLLIAIVQLVLTALIDHFARALAVA